MPHARRVVTFQWLSADGCFAGPDGNLDWVVPDDEQSQSAARDISNVDTFLFGRRTYEMFQSFWSRLVVDDAGTVPDPHRPGRRSPEHGAIATALNTMPKFVFSRTLTNATWTNSRLVPELNPREIETLKQQPGKNILLFGSGSIVSQLTQHGLIDEYQFALCPILLARGQPLLTGLKKNARLDLLEARPLPSGDVILRYARRN